MYFTNYESFHEAALCGDEMRFAIVVSLVDGTSVESSPIPGSQFNSVNEYIMECFNDRNPVMVWWQERRDGASLLTMIPWDRVRDIAFRFKANVIKPTKPEQAS